MLRLLLLAGLIATCACQDFTYSCSVDECTDRCQCASTTPPGGLQGAEVPQFVLITNDDGISPSSVPTIKQILGSAVNRNGCPIPATWFATAAFTKPAMVQQLYLEGHEIACHTYNHIGDPSPEEIISGRQWLANQTGIPLSKLNGFRAPFLQHSPTTRETLAKSGFLYDSSITEIIGVPTSPDAQHRTWPYTMDDGIPQRCNTGKCESNETYPGLWEVPMWAVHNPDSTPISAMDPEGDPFANFKRELDWRYTSNRAPLGLFLHAGMSSAPERIAGLQQFIQYALSLEGVWFVTNQQLIEWMQNPVPVDQLSFNCTAPTDLDPSVKVVAASICSNFVADCVYGTWVPEKCTCACLGEGTASGYCKDAAGACTAACA